jgi:transketolase
MTMDIQEAKRLEDIANRIRVKVVKMIARSGVGHGGGAMSIAELLAVLYFHEMKLDPKNPKLPERDRFVLSKGHGCPALYAAFSEVGYIDDSLLATLHHADGPLQMHPELGLCPGVEMSSGALGQGLSVGIGMALGSRLSGVPFRVYVCMGDGESAEGQIWEAAMCAPKYKLDNLVGILDYNKFALNDTVDKVMSLEPLRDKWTAFGWHVIECNGHSVSQLVRALEEARQVKGKPSYIIMHTVKGRGMKHVEDTALSHSVSFTLEEVEKTLIDLCCEIEDVKATIDHLKEGKH